MTDTPAESAEDPRTLEVYAAAIRAGDDPLAILRLAVAEALVARDTQWREAMRAQDEFCPTGVGTLLWEMAHRDDYAHECEHCAPLCALLSEGKPGQ